LLLQRKCGEVPGEPATMCGWRFFLEVENNPLRAHRRGR